MTDAGFKWTEANITAALAGNTFAGHLCCLPNTTWTGDSEIDLLVVHRSLRVIDVEIKVSRADLKADIAKDKWWRVPNWEAKTYARMAGLPEPERTRRDWPRKVWKHYYAMPADIWRDDLRDAIPTVSGVLLVKRKPTGGGTGRYIYAVECVRASKPQRDSQVLSAEHVMQLARLTSLRLWEMHKA